MRDVAGAFYERYPSRHAAISNWLAAKAQGKIFPVSEALGVQEIAVATPSKAATTKAKLPYTFPTPLWAEEPNQALRVSGGDAGNDNTVNTPTKSPTKSLPNGTTPKREWISP